MSMVSIIIPVLNEENYIGTVLDELKKYVKNIPLKSEIIVVDNGSTDKTRQIVLSKQVKLVEEKERGKGEAASAGAMEAKGDILVFIDGDSSYPAEAIPQLIKPFFNEKIDIVSCSRFLGKPIKINFIRRSGNKILTFLASTLYCPTTDLLTGMLAIRRDRLAELDLESKGFEIETELFIKSYKANLHRIEIPISYKERNRRDSKLHALIDGFKILKTLLKYKL